MSDEEDYLSDKFLIEAGSSSSQPKTYAQRRQEALRQSRVRHEQNRLKSRRQREQESRAEGLRKSLFERAQEDSVAGGENKALGIMLKMGFKIGQSLGRREPAATADEGTPPPDPSENDESSERRDVSSDAAGRAEPLPLNEWSGKKGIGLGKRTRSPGSSDRLAKMAKMAEDDCKESFRDFARQEYEERRAEGRLTAARQTCTALDEMAGVTFNVLWIDPDNIDSMPKGLMEAVLEHTQGVSLVSCNEATRLRDQMRADALQPGTDAEEDHAAHDHSGTDKTIHHQVFPVETIDEAVHFIRLRPQDRLSLVLAYLRDTYAYCFWCGTKYEDHGDLEKHCPGPSEEDHD